MKKFCIVFVFLFIIILTVCMSATPAAGTESEFLRVHIRANSDAVCDQSVKYEVKDAVVDYLMPLAAACQSKAQAMKRIEDVLSEIEQVADGVLRDVTLESGVYDALILELGEASGANWWCVIYPPLCFAGEATGANIRYRSAIYDIIAGFFSHDSGASA